MTGLNFYIEEMTGELCVVLERPRTLHAEDDRKRFERSAINARLYTGRQAKEMIPEIIEALTRMLEYANKRKR